MIRLECLIFKFVLQCQIGFGLTDTQNSKNYQK